MASVEELQCEIAMNEKIIEELMDKLAEYEAQIHILTEKSAAAENNLQEKSNQIQKEENHRQNENILKVPEYCEENNPRLPPDFNYDKYRKFCGEYESMVAKYQLLVKKAKRLEKEIAALNDAPMERAKVASHSLENVSGHPSESELLVNSENGHIKLEHKDQNENISTQASLDPILSDSFRSAILAMPMDLIQQTINIF